MRRGFPVALNLAPPVWRMLTAPLRSNGLRSVGTKADVTKGDLIQILREKGDISKTKAREALDALLQKIMLVVSTGRLF